MKNHKAAVAQFAVTPLAVEDNTRAALHSIRRAAEQGASLVVLPELANTGYVIGRDRSFMLSLYRLAEKLPGPYVTALAEVATETGTHVVAGVCEAHAQLPGVLSNSAVLISPDGTLAVYRKTHIPSEEKHYFAAGADIVPFDTDVGRVGLLVCADNSFPEAARVLTLAGAEILAIPYAARAPRNPDLYAALATARAYENQVFVLAANCVGVQHDMRFAGGSAIAAPDGRLLASLRDEEDVAVAELVADDMLSERLWQSRFRDRRPDLYTPLGAAV